MLPFEPEALVLARARFAAAIASPVVQPLARTHAFDFADGLRLIISREPIPGHPLGPRIVCTASVFPGYPLTAECMRVAERAGTRAATRRLVVAAKHAFNQIAPMPCALRFWGTTLAKGCPCLFVHREPGEEPSGGHR